METGAAERPAVQLRHRPVRRGGNRHGSATVESTMRHRNLLLLGLVLVWSWLVLVNAPGASACSCALPGAPDAVFEGVVTAERSGGFGRDYDFAVDRVVAGQVDRSQTVQVTTGDSAGCGIGQTLVGGARYRVEAHASDFEGQRRLFVNLCGGKVELLAGPAEAPSSGKSGSGPDRMPWIAGAGVAAAAVAGVVLVRRGKS